MRNITTVLRVLSFGLLVFSCQKLNLSPQDKEWNPYEVGDELVFNSAGKTSIKLIISRIELEKSKTNVYAGNLSKQKESLIVFAKNETDNEERPLLVVFKNSDGESFLNFTFALPGFLEVNHVEKIEDLKLKDEDFELIPIANVSPDVTTPYITQFTFSKTRGYLGFTTNSRDHWLLE